MLAAVAATHLGVDRAWRPDETAVTRELIVDSFAPASVTFVEPTELPRDDDDRGRRAVWMAEPEVEGGRVLVAAGMSCGGLCGHGATYVLHLDPAGVWRVTGTTGPEWES